MPHTTPPSDTPSEQHIDFLNADITCEEVYAALKRLKRNKAAGVDGIKAEFILDAADLLLTPLVMTFNQVLQRGVPASWCVGVVHPIFKAGDRDDPGNYRGIIVVVILDAMVLESRATAWAEDRRCRAKGQAGFRKDFRTTDQLFIIRTILQQAKHSKLSSTVVLWISKRHLIWSPRSRCGRCWRGVECQGGFFFHSNPCTNKTKHVCSPVKALQKCLNVTLE